MGDLLDVNFASTSGRHFGSQVIHHGEQAGFQVTPISQDTAVPGYQRPGNLNNPTVAATGNISITVLNNGEMMLRHLGWNEAADLIIKGMDGAIGAKTVTYDFERQMEGATLLKCSEFGDAIIKHMA